MSAGSTPGDKNTVYVGASAAASALLQDFGGIYPYTDTIYPTCPAGDSDIAL